MNDFLDAVINFISVYNNSCQHDTQSCIYILYVRLHEVQQKMHNRNVMAVYLFIHVVHLKN
jgi:hypothetical protein